MAGWIKINHTSTAVIQSRQPTYVGYIKMALGMEMGLGPGHIVLDGNPAPLPKRGRGPAPQFFAHFYCGQPAVCIKWIKMALDTELGLGPDDIVLDGDDPAPLPKKGVEPPPKFSAHVYCGQTAG